MSGRSLSSKKISVVTHIVTNSYQIEIDYGRSILYFCCRPIQSYLLAVRHKQISVFYTIVVAQFGGTSLWFAGNAVLPQLQAEFNWPAGGLGYLTSSTQLGFILGTLSFAVMGLSDRFSPAKLFLVSSVLASAFNLVALIDLAAYPLVLLSRCLTGFFLAGIYPVGMKIAADWKQEGLGQWLGALVGALVLGTAFPHGLKLLPGFVSPHVLLVVISLMAVTGGFLMIALVGDGPYRKKSASFSFSDVGKLFATQNFRSPALGYFGHMWELYAFWAFVPWIVSRYGIMNEFVPSASLWSFFIIVTGAVGCVLGGKWSSVVGSSKVATYALISSGLCCAFSPVIFYLPWVAFILYMLFWGLTVVADSPQFSTLIARSAPDQYRGSAITLSTCIGFTITIFSIQLLNYLQEIISPQYLFLFLLPGPVLGVIAMNLAPRPTPHAQGVTTNNAKS
jgi:MFS family permease